MCCGAPPKPHNTIRDNRADANGQGYGGSEDQCLVSWPPQFRNPARGHTVKYLVRGFLLAIKMAPCDLCAISHQHPPAFTSGPRGRGGACYQAAQRLVQKRVEVMDWQYAQVREAATVADARPVPCRALRTEVECDAVNIDVTLGDMVPDEAPERSVTST